MSNQCRVLCLLWTYIVSFFHREVFGLVAPYADVPSHFFPAGVANGDGYYPTNFQQTFPPSVNWMFYGNRTYISVSSYGSISFPDTPESANIAPFLDPFPQDEPLIAVYAHYDMFTSGNMYARFAHSEFDLAASKLAEIGCDNVTVEYVFVVTWYELEVHGGPDNSTFQAALIGSDSRMFLIMSYATLSYGNDVDVKVGFNKGDNATFFTHPSYGSITIQNDLEDTQHIYIFDNDVVMDASVECASSSTSDSTMTTQRPTTESDPGHTTVFPESSGYIMSPGYSYASYSSFVHSVWTISGLPNHVIEIAMDFIDLELSDNCTSDHVLVEEDNNGNWSHLVQYCGTTRGSPRTTSGDGDVRITFVTDEANNYIGFKLKYNIVNQDYVGSPDSSSIGCGPTPRYIDYNTTASGHRNPRVKIHSPGYVRSDGEPTYTDNQACSWHIHAEQAQQLDLFFALAHLQDSLDCVSDYIDIRDGPSEVAPRLELLCGHSYHRRHLVTSSGDVYIKFSTDSGITDNGFAIEISTIT